MFVNWVCFTSFLDDFVMLWHCTLTAERCGGGRAYAGLAERLDAALWQNTPRLHWGILNNTRSVSVFYASFVMQTN